MHTHTTSWMSERVGGCIHGLMSACMSGWVRQQVIEWLSQCMHDMIDWNKIAMEHVN